jgi:two-component system NtrC family sensor kinase
MVAWLGALSLAGLTLGALHAYVLGRRISRPVAELLAAADQFEPGGTLPKLPAPSRDELGELTARFAGMMNRLEVLHHEQQRAHQKQAGTERLAAIGTLVAGVAHEINNPLAGLKNCLRRIEKRDLTEPKQAEYLEMMSDGLARIEAIVRQLLDFARPSVLESTSVHLSQIVRDNVSLLRPTLGQRRVVWDVEVADAAVQADRKKIGQAFLNIALNAAYVTPDGGRLQIRGASRPGQAGLVIIDEGPGIPAHLKERVWDPFYSTKPEGEGTGLGLPVSRSIVEAHGGELTLEDAPGGGTAVTLWLPLALTAPPVSPSPASP